MSELKPGDKIKWSEKFENQFPDAIFEKFDGEFALFKSLGNMQRVRKAVFEKYTTAKPRGEAPKKPKEETKTGEGKKSKGKAKTEKKSK